MSLREQTNLLAGTRYGNNQEGGLGRIAGKPRLNSSSARTALGNISNKTSTGLSGTISLKNGSLGKPRPALQKNMGTTSLKSVAEKENPMPPPKSGKETEDALKEELRKLEPSKEAVASPMDTSSQVVEAYSRSLLPINVNNIDKEDKENPQLVSEYVNDIYDYMHELERQYSIRPKFLEGQDISGRMRSILYDWLVQVHLRFHLLQETLYLATAIIDRFLQVQTVSKNKLQLVGVTAMLIASKYEEMYAPEVADFVYITDNAYTNAQIREMECCILRTLDFSLGRPLPLHFLRRDSKAGDVDANHHTLAKYLMELTLIDYDMAHHYPSEIAAAALCLSMKLIDNSEWTETLRFYSKYTEEHLLPIMRRMALLVTKAGSGKCTAVKTKYQSSKFMRISSSPFLKSPIITDYATAAIS